LNDIFALKWTSFGIWLLSLSRSDEVLSPLKKFPIGTAEKQWTGKHSENAVEDGMPFARQALPGTGKCSRAVLDATDLPPLKAVTGQKIANGRP
jgi:hypothetical protein